MNSRAALGLVFSIALAGCQSGEPVDAGRPRTAPPPPPGVEGLLARESLLRAETVFLLVSRDRESSLSAFASNREVREEGSERILLGRDRCRIILEGLTIECKEYTIKVVAPPAGSEGSVELLATGGVELKSGGMTNRALLLRADSTSLTFEGDFEGAFDVPLGKAP